MSWLFSCLFVLLIAYNSYRTAKRNGLWSWKEFAIVIVALVAFPLLVTLAMANMPWLNDKPVLFTLIAEVVIILGVCALALILRKFFPTTKKSSS
jgi:predicted permease